MAPNEQIDVPAFMWLDESLSEVFNKEKLRKNAELPQSHDSLFHTLLGLMDVETKLYKKEMDLMTK
jgi:lipid A ethanolaminephosphotransferase